MTKFPISRLPVICCVILAASSAGTAFLLKLHSANLVERFPDTACVTRPTVDCLSDAAVALAAHTSDSFKLSKISADLARAGHIAQAERLLPQIGDTQQHQSSELAIAVFKISWSARSEPHKAADLSPIEQLAQSKRLMAYYLLALDLLGRHPFSGGGDPHVVAVEQKAWQRPVPLASTTLDRILQQCKTHISDLSSNSRGTAWIDLASTLIDLDRPEEAKEALESAASTTPAELISLIARQWLRLGDTDRALQISDTSSRPSAEIYFDIAKAIFSRDANSPSISPILSKAFDLAAVAFSGTPNFELERHITTFALNVRNFAAVDRMKVAMIRQARTPGPFQPANLATSAAIALDAGDRSTADALLVEAEQAFQKDERAVVAVGTVTGPMSYATWHIADRMRANIGIQYYRLGEMAKFDDLFDKISADYRFYAWRELYNENLPSGIPEPPIGRLKFTERVPLMALRAAQEAEHGDKEKARIMLEELLHLNAVGGLGALMDSRLAIALNYPDLAQQFFLREVALIAKETDDAGIKALQLSHRAAFLAETLNKYGDLEALK